MAASLPDGATPGERAPPLTFDNLYSLLEEVKEEWKNLLNALLGVNVASDQYDSDEAALKDVVERYLQQEHNRRTWRGVIMALDMIGEVHVADKIMSFGEPVHDSTLTTVNVTSVMELVKKLDSLCGGTTIIQGAEIVLHFIIPDHRLDVIRSSCSTNRELASEYASYYVHCYPQPSWTHLASCLYWEGEFTAVEKCKPFLPLRDLTISTEKLVELFATVRDDKVDRIAGFLGLRLASSKTDDIRKNYHNPAQRRDAYLDLYATDHPCPSWSKVARLLCEVGLRHQSDEVERTYVQVSERTRHNFEEAMKEGVLNIRNGNSFMMGAGGSGKTLSLHAILREKISKLRQSTPCVKKGIRAVAQYKIVGNSTAGKPSFVRITDEQFSDMLSTSATYVMRSRIDLTTTHHQSATAGFGETLDVRLSPLSPGTSLEPGSQSGASSSAIVESQPSLASGFHKELLVRMNTGSRFSIHLDDKDLFDFRDSGGQSMFHEVLPIFVDNTMFGFLTVKLNESLDSHPMVEYYASGKLIGKPFRSPFSHKQIFRHCMRALHSTSGKCPKIAFIGTHKDLEYQCKDETLEAKNRKLLSIIPPQMRDNVISYKGDSLIFPINALNPGDDDEAVLDVLRQLIMNELQKLPQTPIPLRYFALESAFQRLAKEKNKGILSLEECFKEAEALHFTREGFMDALRYLSANKLVFYYESILPDVVFINAQVLLDMITAIIEHYLIQVGSESGPVGSSLGANKKFLCGIITREILSRFKSHYISKLFEEKHLILLFEHLLIAAKVGEGEYLMSSLLREEAIPHPSSDPASKDVPALLFYFGEDGPKLGIYCSLLSTLITDSKWKLLMENACPVQLSRNRARFMIPGNDPGFVTITDSFSTHFQVDIAFPSIITVPKRREICERVCPIIRETILAGIRKASRKLNYTNSIPEVGFICTKHQPNSLYAAIREMILAGIRKASRRLNYTNSIRTKDSTEHQPTSLHAAVVSKSKLLTCTTHPTSVCSEMKDGHRLWLGQVDSASEGKTHQKTTVSHSQTRFYLMAAVALVFAIVLAVVFSLHNNVNPTVPQMNSLNRDSGKYPADTHVHSNSYGGGLDKRKNFPHMNDRPKMQELSNLDRSGGLSRVKIIERIGGEKSSALGDILLNDEHGVRMNNIKEEKRSVEAVNREMFRLWLEESGASASWKVLVDALDTVGLNTLADDIIDALSNQRG